MRTSIALSCLILGIATCVGLVPSVNGQEGRPPGDRERLADRLQDLNLTDAQEAKVMAICKEYRPKVAETAKALMGLVRNEEDHIRAVLTPEQRLKLLAMKDERRESREDCVAHAIAHFDELDLTDAEMTKIEGIRKEYRPKIVKDLQDLKGLLTPEQVKAREEGLKAGKKRSEVLASLNFTPEQKEKAGTIGNELKTLVREELEKIRDVLSEGQKEALAEFKDERQDRVRDRMAHRIANLKELGLTQEQMTKIMDIRKEFRPQVHEAANKLRATIREEVEAVVNAIKE